jgi:hypothetical protein
MRTANFNQWTDTPLLLWIVWVVINNRDGQPWDMLTFIVAMVAMWWIGKGPLAQAITRRRAPPLDLHLAQASARGAVRPFGVRGEHPFLAQASAGRRVPSVRLIAGIEWTSPLRSLSGDPFL